MDNRLDLQTPGSPGAAPVARLRGVVTGVLTAAALLASALPWATASAQAPATRATYITDENGKPHPLAKQSAFNLFSEADVAISGMRMTGTYGWEFPNVGGPCPWYYTNNSERCGQVVNRAGNWTDTFFEYGFAAGVPITDFRKIRTLHSGANNMRAPLGYSVAYRFQLAPPQAFRWGAADGQFGSYYSGVTSTEDGSCRDHASNLSGRVPAGLTLTAGSDCPETWANGQFNGERLITGDTWLARAQANPGAFRFDSWKVPASQKEATFLGDFSTYGAFSDHYREILQRFGSVTPQGAGASSERGFPMGLEVRYDAWQYSRPSIRNVVWYQMTIVNKSAQVYGGNGVDYDSLYFALTPGFLMSGSGSQSAAMYFDYNRNAVLATGHGTSGRCSTTYPFRTAASGGCTTTRGFADGNNAFIILKSPMGDTRNKLFTRSGSPFAALGVPDEIKDDTITFNHARSSGFGGLANNFMNRNDKAFFGYMASIEDVFLDGRTVADFTAGTAYRHFMGEVWRTYAGSLTPQFLRFPRFVPGSTIQPNNPRLSSPGQPYGKWDYNNDGIQDTIFVPGCGSTGCHDTYSDTIAGGTNNVFGNVANIIGMGPIKLRAGDTTQILVAHAGASDSLTFESQINAAVETYLNFYAGPAAVQAPRLTSADVQVTSAEVRDITAGSSTAQIRLRIPELGSSADPYIQRVADQLNTGTSPLIDRLRRYNPNLVSQVQARARNNLAEILVFKSCDRGATFTTESYNQTTGAGCTPAPARDPLGRSIGFGWQAFRTIPIDTANVPGTRFITDVVQAGRTYLYSFVTRTRGLIDIRIVDSVGFSGGRTITAPTNLAQALSLDADTIVSALARSGPSTVIVYAPISLPAGTRTATLDTIRMLGNGTTRVGAELTGGELTSGNYALYFANRFIVTTLQNAATGTVTSTTVRAQRVIRGATTNGTTRDTALVADERTFTADGRVFASSDNLFPVNLVSTVNGVRTYVDTINVAAGDTTGYIFARVGTGAPRALYISRISRSSASVNAGTRTAFENVSYFPGFRVVFENPTAGRNVPRLSVVVRAEGDTISPAVVTNNGVVPITNGTLTASQTQYYWRGGTYRLEWADDAWGPNSNFTYQTPEQLAAAVQASLAARTNVQTTDSSDATLALITARVAADTSVIRQNLNRPLIRAQLPFRVIGSNGQPATVAMFRRWADGANAVRDSIANNTRLLGNGGDTLRVPVPRNLWLPNDTIYVIETVKVDSTVTIGGATTVVTAPVTLDGRTLQEPIQVDRQIVSARLVLSCTGTSTPNTTAAPRCNPLVPGTFAASGYLPYEPGWASVIQYQRSFDLFSEFEVRAEAPSAVGVQLTAHDLADIKVVPNPYIVQSSFDNIQGNARVGVPRVVFTGVPTQGKLTVYSVSGQMLQQVTWTESDLMNIGTGRITGDLPFTLRTREGLDMGSGLYVFVLQSTGTGPSLTKRGKFVVIR